MGVIEGHSGESAKYDYVHAKISPISMGTVVARW